MWHAFSKASSIYDNRYRRSSSSSHWRCCHCSSQQASQQPEKLECEACRAKKRVASQTWIASTGPHNLGSKRAKQSDSDSKRKQTDASETSLTNQSNSPSGTAMQAVIKPHYSSNTQAELKRDWVIILQVAPSEEFAKFLKACAANCSPQVHQHCFQRESTLHFTLHKQKMSDSEAAEVQCSLLGTRTASVTTLPQPLVLQLGRFKEWPTCVALSVDDASGRDLRSVLSSHLSFRGISSLNQVSTPKLHLSLYRLRGMPAAVAKPEFNCVRQSTSKTWFQQGGGGAAGSKSAKGLKSLSVVATRITLKVVGSDYDDCRVLASFPSAESGQRDDGSNIGSNARSSSSSSSAKGRTQGSSLSSRSQLPSSCLAAIPLSPPLADDGRYLPLPPSTVRVGGRDVNAVGLGTLPLGVTYSGGGRPSKTDAIAVIHAALDAGINFFDTADSYCRGPGEEHYTEVLLGEALRSYQKHHQHTNVGRPSIGGSASGGAGVGVGADAQRHRESGPRKRWPEGVVVATKGGMVRTGETSRGWAPRSDWLDDPHAFKRAVHEQRDALYSGGGVGAVSVEMQDSCTQSRQVSSPPINLWQFHHTDGFDSQGAPFRSLLEACAELVDEGVISAVGLCNCSLSHLERAQEILGPTAARGVASVQNHFSLWDRAAEKPPKLSARPVAKSNKNNLLPACHAQGIPFLAHGALGGHQAREGKRDLGEFSRLAAMARAKGCSPHALALAWMRHKWPCIVHIVGARTIHHIHDIFSSKAVRLTKQEFDVIDAL